jgi:hypothetical protein
MPVTAAPRARAVATCAIFAKRTPRGLKAALERKGQRIENFDAAMAAHALALSQEIISRRV